MHKLFTNRQFAPTSELFRELIKTPPPAPPAGTEYWVTEISDFLITEDGDNIVWHKEV